jgi:hypothetical protein
MSPTVIFIHKPNFVKQWAIEHFWNFCFKSHECPGSSVCLGIWEVVETLFHSVHSDKAVSLCMICLLPFRYSMRLPLGFSCDDTLAPADPT